MTHPRLSHAGITLAVAMFGLAPAAKPQASGPPASEFAGSSSVEAYLKASNTDAGDRFGQSVSISGDTLVVGGRFEDSGATGVNGNQNDETLSASGAAYVFTRGTDGLWAQEAYLKASNPDIQDEFGTSVAVSGDTLVVGAPVERSNATGVNGDQMNDSAVATGAAYVFVRVNGIWTQEAYLKASNSGGFDRFGQAVAISGDSILVGAFHEKSLTGSASDDSGSTVGAAYIFVRDGAGTWSEQAYLKASNPDSTDRFGESVSIDGDTAIIGAPGERSNATGVNGNQSDNSSPATGAAYVFERTGVLWTQQAYLKASTANGGFFGQSVGVSNGTVVVGAFNKSHSSLSSPGRAYVFTRDAAQTWSEQASLDASNADENDRLGWSAAISGDLIVVGALEEDSLVPGDDANNGADNAGAAYAFARSGTEWTQTAYLKASHPGANDFFATTVAISGTTVVVGAVFEDSAAVGVDGDSSNNGSENSGAAYTFALNAAGPWTNEGCALGGVSGDPLLVGAGTLAAGTESSFHLSNAAPDAPCVLFAGASSTPISFKGGTLKAFPFAVGLVLSTGPTGTLSVPFILPALPPGTELWGQFAVDDDAAIFNVSLSNAVVGLTP